MKKLEELFNRDDFSVCKAQKTELGYKTQRFNIETAIEALCWLKKSSDNSVLFIHKLYGNKPVYTELNFAHV